MTTNKKTEQQTLEEKVALMSVYEKLSHIQNEMKVPKNLYNKFGGYNYRNAETILETAKPICMKYHTTLTVQDNIVQIGERYYIEAVACLTDWQGHSISNKAYAREALDKKGMDQSQVTGSCSSYARKYALNGLFNIDDTKDADSEEQHNEIEQRKKGVNKNDEKLGELMSTALRGQQALTQKGIDIRGAEFMANFTQVTGITKSDVSTMNIKELGTAIKYYSDLFKQLGGKK